jgi:Domain of unknown function (DUF2760)
MNANDTIMNTYAIDLSLRPTTFDLWHVCLAGTVVVLMSLLILVLLVMIFSRSRAKPVEPVKIVQQPAEPIVKIVEKIVEVEKLVQAPTPEPVILKEYTPDAAMQVLGLLQKDARFIDFIKEDITAYSDADIGAAARVVHEGCKKTIGEHFVLAPIRSEQEGSRISVPAGFDASAIRLTGNIVGSAPFNGTLVHKGWQVTEVHLPKLTQGHNPNIVAAAEVEL